MLRDGETHRLILGDALAVLPGLPDGCFHTVITDPPYGARRPSARRSASERFAEVNGNDGIHADWLPEAYRVTADAGACYVFSCWDRLGEWRAEMAFAGFRVRNCIVWDKLIHGLGDLETCWAPQHEMILFGAKGRHELLGKRPVDIVRAMRVAAKDLFHPYEKPVNAVRPLVVASCPPGGVVLDMHAGSGTTGVACLQTGRRFVGIEIDPDHAAVAQKRLDDAANSTPLFDPPPAQAGLFDTEAP